jgi:tRNA pseudouridine55 synthase
VTEPIGLAVLDKPAGMTSHDVVARMRRILSERRVGHAGTLDPPATGVLLIGVGRATRLLRFLQGTDKSYEGTLELGTATSTLDATGEVVATFDMTGIAARDVEAAARALTGTIEQVPPMVSAVSIGGRRLHELAREGKEVERAPRTVRVSRFNVAHLVGGTYAFTVDCSSGTYVRTLADDLGRSLGGGAHVASLRRTRVGRFTLDDATTLEALTALGPVAPSALSPPASMVAHLPQWIVNAQEAIDLGHGKAVRWPLAAAAGTPVAVLDHDGALVAVCVDNGSGTLRPDVVLAAQGTAPGHD